MNNFHLLKSNGGVMNVYVNICHNIYIVKYNLNQVNLLDIQTYLSISVFRVQTKVALELTLGQLRRNHIFFNHLLFQEQINYVSCIKYMNFTVVPHINPFYLYILVNVASIKIERVTFPLRKLNFSQLIMLICPKFTLNSMYFLLYLL